MDVYRERDVIGHLHEIGGLLRAQVEEAIAAAGVEDFVGVGGRSSNLGYRTLDQDGQPSQPFRTLFLQELVRGGVLAPSFVVSYAHDEEAVRQTVAAVAGALAVYRRALDEGVEHYLVGPSVKPVYRRFN
jgi:glutamate-1-semialdehyde 2,1-aminomutase